MQSRKFLLAGDIGGTKTTLAYYDPALWPGPPLREKTYSNRDATCLEELIDRFLSEFKLKPKIGCFGAAGPIHDNQVELTNLEWIISSDRLKKAFGFTNLFLVNDLVATAMGAVNLPTSDLTPINREQPGKGTVAVIAPGTGLGEAILADTETGYTPLASEGGHTSFAPRNRQQIDLLEFLLKRYEHVSYEQVCSGSGIPHLFDFMATRTPIPQNMIKALENSKDQTPLIIKAAMDCLKTGNLQHIAVQTVSLFVDILADESANLALKTMCEGGLYIAGGLPVRILPYLTREQRFMKVFCRGLYSEWLERIPVQLVLNHNTAVYGAAAYGFKQMSVP